MTTLTCIACGCSFAVESAVASEILACPKCSKPMTLPGSTTATSESPTAGAILTKNRGGEDVPVHPTNTKEAPKTKASGIVWLVAGVCHFGGRWVGEWAAFQFGREAPDTSSLDGITPYIRRLRTAHEDAPLPAGLIGALAGLVACSLLLQTKSRWVAVIGGCAIGLLAALITGICIGIF